MLTKLTSSIIFEPYLFIKIDILYKITYLILFLMILFLFLFLPLKNYYYFVDLLNIVFIPPTVILQYNTN